MKYLSVIMLLTVAFFYSCDDDTAQVDTEAPVINILSPAYSSGGEYFSDSTIYIDVEVTDNDEIHEVGLSLVQDYMRGVVPRGEVMHRHYHPDAPMLTIDEEYLIDTAHHSNFWLYIDATDHNRNSARDSVLVHVHS